MLSFLFKYFPFFIDAGLLIMGAFLVLFSKNDGYNHPLGWVISAVSLLMFAVDIKYCINNNKTQE